MSFINIFMHVHALCAIICVITTLCLRKNAPTLKRYSSKLCLINFDDISNVPRIESACFSFHVDLLFLNFWVFKPDTENNAN